MFVSHILKKEYNFIIAIFHLLKFYSGCNLRVDMYGYEAISGYDIRTGATFQECQIQCEADIDCHGIDWKVINGIATCRIASTMTLRPAEGVIHHVLECRRESYFVIIL